MFRLQVFVVVVMVLVAGSLSHPGKGKGKGKHHEKMEKMKACHEQTKVLAACCGFPKFEDKKKDYPECDEHLEGLDGKCGKEKHHAFSCYMECVFKAEGAFDGEALVEEKIKENIEKMLTDAGEEVFNEIAGESVGYCKNKIDEQVAQWKEKLEQAKADGKDWAKDWEEKKGDEKRCSFLPMAFGGCFMGNVVRNCPAEKWSGSDDCEDFKANNVTTMQECMS